MSRTTKWFRCSVLAVASVAMLGLPSAASAHQTGNHAPVTAACPGGDPLSNAICFGLRGLEYSVRHGGTVEAANELATKTQANKDAYTTAIVQNVGTFRTAIEVAVDDLGTGEIDGIVNALLESDLYGAGLIDAADASLGPAGPQPCPLNDVNPGVFPNTVQALKVFFCAQWATVVALLPGVNAQPLVDHIGLLPGVLGDIEAGLREPLQLFGDAMGAAGITLGTATDAATRALGANQVLDTFYAAQCVRKGDYGPFTRPTACPVPPES